MGTFASGRPGTVSNRRLEDLRTSRYQRGYLMPNIVDVARFPDEDNDKWKEVLRILFLGRLPEDVPINAAASYYKLLAHLKYTVGDIIKEMRHCFPKEDPKLKVDKIIYVANYTEPIPQRLIKNVLDAAKPTGIPIFGVLTKEDKVDTESQEAKDKRQLFRDSLGINDSRVLSCSNYCPEIDKKLGFDRLTSGHPQLDVPILNFICKVCNPSTELRRDEPMPQIYLKIFYIFFFAINAIAIATVMFYVFNIPVDAASFISVCLQVQDGGIKNSALSTLCDATRNGKVLQPNFIYTASVPFISTLVTVAISYLFDGYISQMLQEYHCNERLRAMFTW